MTAKKNPGGKPPKFKTKEDIQEKIDAYFKACEGEILKDKEGNPMLNKWGNPIIFRQRPPTVTGLALALGFTSRQALLNYQAKKEFVDTITRAKSMVEEYTEQRLFDKDGSSGAQFSLRNNFAGWNDHTRSALDEEEKKARIEQIHAQTELLKARAQADDIEEAADDGFVEALKGTAADDWEDGPDEES
nr:MAG TPA: DNA packaging protein gp3 [Caudoviricetes sp.]